MSRCPTSAWWLAQSTSSTSENLCQRSMRGFETAQKAWQRRPSSSRPRLFLTRQATHFAVGVHKGQAGFSGFGFVALERFT